MQDPDDATIEQAVRDLPGWTRRGGHLVRTFVHDDFHSAVQFVERVATAADAMACQPEVGIHGGAVTLTLGGGGGAAPSADDLALARRIQRLGGEHRHPVGLAGP